MSQDLYRFATITPDDQSGSIYIAVFLGFTYSSITFIARCFIKWHMFGFDDWAVCVAQAAMVAQFILILVSLSAGLGKNLDILKESDYLRMVSSQYANQVLFYLALGISKCSAVLLIQRLFTRDARKFWMICRIVTGVMAVWTVFAALTVSVGCHPKGIAPLGSQPLCSNLATRYKVVVVLDCITDVLLVIVPAYLVWQLQMTTKLKLQVLSAFAFRLPLLAFSVLSLKYFIRSLSSPNPGVERTRAIIFQQSELCYSLLAATLPCLKAFIRSFDTGSGAKAGITTAGYSSGNGYHSGNSYKMQSLSGKNSALQSVTEDNGHLKVNSKPFSNAGHGRGRATSTTKVSSAAYSTKPGDKEDSSIASHGSQEMIIRRDVKWEITSANIP